MAQFKCHQRGRRGSAKRIEHDGWLVDTYEAIDAVLAGRLERTELERLTRVGLPTSGSCPGQFTANSMGMVSEAIGLAMLGSSKVPAVFAERDALNRRTGRIVTAAVLRGPLPRDIVLENACAVVAATGGSTNAVLHIPAIANEAGMTSTRTTWPPCSPVPR
jgi:dihydroxy-acid dehydratase